MIIAHAIKDLLGTPNRGHPDVPQSLCSPISMFPGPMFPSIYVPQSVCAPVLCSPIPMFPGPMFPGPYVPQSLCSPVPMFPYIYVPPYLYSPSFFFFGGGGGRKGVLEQFVDKIGRLASFFKMVATATLEDLFCSLSTEGGV